MLDSVKQNNYYDIEKVILITWENFTIIWFFLEVQYFKIISEVDNQALEGTEDDGKASMSPESSDNGFQLW